MNKATKFAKIPFQIEFLWKKLGTLSVFIERLALKAKLT